MPDDAYIQSALERTFRRRLAAEPATLTVADLEAYCNTALTGMAAGTTVVQMNLEGGGGSAVINCSPAVLLAACETILAEQAALNDENPDPTGTTHLDLSRCRIES